MLITRKQQNIYSEADMKKLLKPNQYLAEEEYGKLVTMFKRFRDSGLVENARDHKIVKVLENIKTFPLGNGKWLVFETSSKVWNEVIPTEFKQSMIAYLERETLKEFFSIDQILHFDKKEYVERIKGMSELEWRRTSGKVTEVQSTNKSSTLFERNGKFYKIKAEFIESVTNARDLILRPMRELRHSIVTKDAKRYISQKFARAKFTVVTHGGNVNVAFVNEKMAKKMRALGILVKKEMAGQRVFMGMNTRYPETMYAGLNLIYRIDNNLPDYTVALSDVALMFLMGDTDGDTVVITKPLFFGFNEINRRMRQNTKVLREFYKNQNESFFGNIKKFRKAFGNVVAKEWNVEEIFEDFRVALSLNEGVDSMTGELVNWGTKTIMKMIELGYDADYIEDFVTQISGFVAQISIASKNNTKEGLAQVRDDWSKVKNLGEDSMDVVDRFMNSVELTVVK